MLTYAATGTYWDTDNFFNVTNSRPDIITIMLGA